MIPVGLRDVTILVVDDDPDALELMGMFLRPTGATVVEAADGDQALMQALRRPPDGFAGHLVKPILPEMVDALLGKVLEQRRRSA